MLTPLPLHTQLVYSAYTESTPFPIPQGGEARKELTHSPFLVTHRQDTLSAQSTHLPLPFSSFHSDVPIITASLLCSAFPSHCFLYSRDSPVDTEVEKTLIVIFYI